jgi:hypothetical protein
MVHLRTRGGGASARSLARRLGLPAVRGAAVAALAATVLLGGPATASAVGAMPGGPAVPDSVLTLEDRAAVDDGAASSAAQRLAAMGTQWSKDRLDDALAVGRAALVAADASSALAGQDVDVAGLSASVDALRTLVRTHDGGAVRQRAGGGAPVLPDSVSVPPDLTAAERLLAVQEISDLSADVFRLALQVEATATRTGPGLPGLDAPPLQLTAPRPLEALAVPTPAVVAPPVEGSVPGDQPVEPATVPDADTAVAPEGAGDPSGAAEPDTAAIPGSTAGPEVLDPIIGTQGEPIPMAALPVDLVVGLAELEAAVAAAAGAGTYELLGLDAQPVVPSALHAAAVQEPSSFLPASWSTLGLENGRIPTALLCAPAFAPTALLRCDAAAALETVNEAYRAKFGEDLVVTSAYRTYEQQAALKIAKGWLAAPAGRSNHGLGVAVDLGGFGALGQFDSPRYRWMLEHGEQFGWFHPEAMRPGGGGPPEPWHFEFSTDD